MNTSWSEYFAGRIVLVTGAQGFLGRHVARHLIACGAEVHGTSRAAQPEGSRGVRWQQSDLLSAEDLGGLFRRVRPQVVLHLAGYAEGLRGPEHLLPSFLGDLATTVHLLAACNDFGVERLVLAGSLEEPAPGPQPPIPTSPYAASKWAATGYAQMCHALYGTPVTIARVFMTYGPGQRPRKVIPSTILALLDGRAPQLASGTRPVDWIYVDDVAQGLLAMAAQPGMEGRILDLGSGTLISIRDVVCRIVALMESPLMPQFGALPDPRQEEVRCANIDATCPAIAWKPSTPLDEGLRRTIAWYRDQRN